MPIVHPFKLKKALKQAHQYIDTINRLHDQLGVIVDEQNAMIKRQSKTIDELRQQVREKGGIPS